MNRRRFLETSGVGSLALFANACAMSRVADRDGGDAGEPAHDGAILVSDGAPFLIDANDPSAIVVAAGFSVLLNDSSCSHHSHGVDVAAGAYAPDVAVHFLGGSHELVFLGSELALLERGERIPFATIGPGPGHGHCGTAWRTEVGPEERDRIDVCQPRGTAMCE
jgi:hypothetical protein